MPARDECAFSDTETVNEFIRHSKSVSRGVEVFAVGLLWHIFMETNNRSLFERRVEFVLNCHTGKVYRFWITLTQIPDALISN
jgi:hypothetical protein